MFIHFLVRLTVNLITIYIMYIYIYIHLHIFIHASYTYGTYNVTQIWIIVIIFVSFVITGCVICTSDTGRWKVFLPLRSFRRLARPGPGKNHTIPTQGWKSLGNAGDFPCMMTFDDGKLLELGVWDGVWMAELRLNDYLMSWMDFDYFWWWENL